MSKVIIAALAPLVDQRTRQYIDARLDALDVEIQSARNEERAGRAHLHETFIARIEALEAQLADQATRIEKLERLATDRSAYGLTKAKLIAALKDLGIV